LFLHLTKRRISLVAGAHEQFWISIATKAVVQVMDKNRYYPLNFQTLKTALDRAPRRVGGVVGEASSGVRVDARPRVVLIAADLRGEDDFVTGNMFQRRAETPLAFTTEV